MKRSRHVPGPAATCLVLTLLSIFAPAKPAGAGDETVEWLPEIVVTASRVRQNLQSVPATAHRLEAPAKVVREGVRTTPDMVGGLPSVMVQKTSYGQGSPYLRGFTGFRTLGLVDGIRLNNSVFRDGPNQYWNTVDPLSIARYEAVMGPASVLYGSDAIGGLVNALPLEPPGDIGWTTRLLYRGATAEESHVGRIQVMGRPDERWGVVGGFSWKTFGDLRGGRDVGRQEHTGYDEWALDGRADYYLKDDARLTLAHQSLRQDDAWRTHRTVYGIDWKGLSRGDDKVHSFDQQRDLTWLKYDAGLAGRFADRVTVTLSRQAQGEGQDERCEHSFGGAHGRWAPWVGRAAGCATFTSRSPGCALADAATARRLR